jgi:N-sulfoglucosamine sulfohydrolase
MEGLYDLIFDPNEVRNLASDPSQQIFLDEMRGRLDRWMQATKDPILQGPIKAPRGAEINDPDQDSYLEPVTISE